MILCRGIVDPSDREVAFLCSALERTSRETRSTNIRSIHPDGRNQPVRLNEMKYQ